MSARKESSDVGATLEAFVGWLGGLRGGTVRATIDGSLLAELDAREKTMTVALDTFGDDDAPNGLLPPGEHLGWWSALRFPAALAHAGWQVRVQEHGQELARLGRGVSALTGHVRAHPSAVGRLRRLLRPARRRRD